MSLERNRLQRYAVRIDVKILVRHKKEGVVLCSPELAQARKNDRLALLEHAFHLDHIVSDS